MHWFYCPDILSDHYILSEEESKHCSKVLRLKEGDEIVLVDGNGGYFKAQICDKQSKRTEVKIIETQEKYNKRKFHLHIAIAPTKNIDRFEWFLEKVTEIGVDEITPLLCDFSERKVIKPDRLQKILISAMKQSEQAYLPKLNELTKYSDFIKESKSDIYYIAHCYNTLKVNLTSDCPPGKKVVILIGPEGDFSLPEVEQATKNGYKSLDLGINRLRTETAGIVACCSVNHLNLHT
ncbi:MAG: 16S rRNA (uracil(1498)-N(3))-methyltransferase [Bacteroidales bacterium]|nr:16S rRNA (uracil(1498)-N(3))-methyltransferase [Bacteroidales bacterium]